MGAKCLPGLLCFSFSEIVTHHLYLLHNWRFSRYSTSIHWLVHDHMTSNSKLFPAKCQERATLRKLWRQTGNSSLLPATCWPLLHMIRGGLMLSLESWRVFALVAAYKLLCYHRRNLFVCVSRIARPSGRDWVGLYEGDVRYGGHGCFKYM